MKKILLFCAGGMTTSLLAQKLNDYAKLNKLPYTVEAFSVGQVTNVADQFDIILSGPHLAFKIPDIKKTFPKKPAGSIEPMDFGRMKVENIFKLVKELDK